MTMTATITAYRITASLDRDGQQLAMDTAEVLGDAYGQIYTREAEAESDRDDLEDGLSDTDLDPATEYAVESIEITVSDATGVRDSEYDLIEITARVEIAGIFAGQTSWSARDDGEAPEPAGDSIDCWTDHTLACHVPVPLLVSIGHAVLGLAKVAP